MRSRVEVHTWPNRRAMIAPRGLGDASSDFAANATVLHQLAAKAYAAKLAGDGPTYAVAMNQFRRTLAMLLPQQVVTAKAALERDMPSAFLRDLAGWSDKLTSVLKNPALMLLIVAGVGFFILHGATRGMAPGAPHLPRRDW